MGRNISGEAIPPYNSQSGFVIRSTVYLTTPCELRKLCSVDQK